MKTEQQCMFKTKRIKRVKHDARASPGKEINESVIKEALHKRAIGYASEEVVEEYSAGIDDSLRLTKRKVTKKDIPPDISAAKVLLELISEDDIKDMDDDKLLLECDRLLKLLKEEGSEEENEN